MPRCSGRVIQFPPAGRAAEEMLGVVFGRIADALPDICLAECRSFLFMPGVGVPSHPQPFLGHFAPVFFLDFGAAPLCLQAAVFRVSSKILRLGCHVHVQPQSPRQLGKASVNQWFRRATRAASEVGRAAVGPMGKSPPLARCRGCVSVSAETVSGSDCDDRRF
jgi:hypothetical protein